MYRDRLFCIALYCMLYVANCRGIDEVEANHTDVMTTRPMKWFKNVKDIFSSPTGHVVAQVAKELINRSTGNSQVSHVIMLVFTFVYV